MIILFKKMCKTRNSQEQLNKSCSLARNQAKMELSLYVHRMLVELKLLHTSYWISLRSNYILDIKRICPVKIGDLTC